MHLQLHLIFETTLLNNWLRKANTTTIPYSDKGCFHTHNVITAWRHVNPISAPFSTNPYTYTPRVTNLSLFANRWHKPVVRSAM